MAGSVHRSPGDRPRVVIVVGGFGGLFAARALRHAPVSVTLVDRRNFHLFQPLLYQVALGELSPANVASPLRSVLRRQRNLEVVLAEAVGIDAAGRRVLLADGAIVYDILVLAAGSRHHYFGHPDWEAKAPGLKTVEDATEIRRRVLLALETAERIDDDDARRPWLTFVVVGAGPTGVELAGALAEIARHTRRDNFRRFTPGQVRVVLVEGADRVLPQYVPAVSTKAAAALARLGVAVRTGAVVSEVQDGRVVLRAGGRTEALAARTVLWAAGVEASPLGRALAEATGAPLDGAGRVVVEPDLSVLGHPEIFVLGDLANYSHQGGKLLPGVAPVAMQQGAYVARALEARLAGRGLPPFRYKDRGSMAVIGRGRAVADLGWARFDGVPAWLAWLFIHLINLVQFQNRLLVLIQWAANYLTWNPSARLITGAERLHRWSQTRAGADGARQQEPSASVPPPPAKAAERPEQDPARPTRV